MKIHARRFEGSRGLLLLYSLILSFLLPSIALASERRYEAHYPGAIALIVSFSDKTKAPKNGVFIVRGGKGKKIGKYPGMALKEMRVFIMGEKFSVKMVGGKVSEFHLDIQNVQILTEEDLKKEVTYDYSKILDKTGKELRKSLYELIKNHVTLGYKQGRIKLFSDFYNVSGQVQCVYTGEWVKTLGIPKHTNMNTEHTWPKSKGSKTSPSLSDLHHLFPTRSKANSRRSNYPFGVVQTVTWKRGGSVLGLDERGVMAFTPRPTHRGNVARAMFYFSIRYNLPIDSVQESALRQWHWEDPVDFREKKVNGLISIYQKNRNPFIDYPELVFQIHDF